MKEKELESIDNAQFGAFDPEDESWLVGGSKTVTGGPTGTPDSPDAWVDMDYFEVQQTGPQT